MNDRLTRRQVIERATLGGAAIAFPGLLAACGGTATKGGAGTTTVQHKLAKTLHFSNWTLYIDNKRGGRHPSLEQFQKKTGVHVAYNEDINDNPSFFSKIQPALQSGQSTGRDLIVMTDNSRYPSLLISKGWVEKLDKSAIPNIKNLIPQQRHPNWDPNRDYSLPWQSGMTGIGWNEKLTDPVTSMDQLLGDKKLKGKVALLTEFADTLDLSWPRTATTRATVTDETFNKAIATIQKAVNSGPDPPVLRQRLQRPAREGRPRGDDGLVGRHRPAPGRQPAPEVEPPATRAANLDRQHADPEGRQRLHGVSTYMNFVYDPKIAARDRGLRQLHLPGARGEGGSAQGGPVRSRRTP